MAGWIRDRFGSLLDNALYEGVRLLIVAIVLPVLYAAWRFLMDKPLQWTVLIVFIAFGLLAFALLGFGALNKKKHRSEQPLVPIQTPKMPIVPAQDLSYLADPAYDRFWGADSWREGLLKRGQGLVEQWTTRLEYPEKQRREHDSKNWLGEVNQFARKHLTSAQMNEFTLRHSTAASVDKKYDFAMALTQAGTVPSSEDGNLAFEIFGKLMLLERFRSEPSPTQAKLPKSRSPKVTKVIDGAMHVITERKVWPLYAMQKAGVGDLDSEEEFLDVREAIIQHGLGDPLAGCWITKEEPKWLDFTKFANRKGLQLSSVSEVLDHLNDYCFGESTRPS